MERIRKKSSAIKGGRSQVTGLEGLRTQGKGDKYRPISGWYSDETKKKMEKIFGKKTPDKKKNEKASR